MSEPRDWHYLDGWGMTFNKRLRPLLVHLRDADEKEIQRLEYAAGLRNDKPCQTDLKRTRFVLRKKLKKSVPRKRL